jgi:hypothetical protein
MAVAHEEPGARLRPEMFGSEHSPRKFFLGILLRQSNSENIKLDNRST